MTDPAAAPSADPNAPAPGAGDPVVAPPPPADPAAAPPPADPKAGEGEIAYDFKAPDGVTLDAARLERFTALAKELKLPADKAQALVDMAAQAEVERAQQHATLVSGWADSVRNDPEIGGDKLAENLGVAKKALDLGPPELKELLNTSGLGNHPAVVKWALAVGKALSEDKFISAGQASSGPKDAASRLYPSSSPA